jgi:hypothetical protein
VQQRYEEVPHNRPTTTSSTLGPTQNGSGSLRPHQRPPTVMRPNFPPVRPKNIPRLQSLRLPILTGKSFGRTFPRPPLPSNPAQSGPWDFIFQRKQGSSPDMNQRFNIDPRYVSIKKILLPPPPHQQQKEKESPKDQDNNNAFASKQMRVHPSTSSLSPSKWEVSIMDDVSVNKGGMKKQMVNEPRRNSTGGSVFTRLPIKPKRLLGVLPPPPPRRVSANPYGNLVKKKMMPALARIPPAELKKLTQAWLAKPIYKPLDVTFTPITIPPPPPLTPAPTSSSTTTTTKTTVATPTVPATVATTIPIISGKL